MPQIDEEMLRQISDELTQISARLTQIESRLADFAGVPAQGAPSAPSLPPGTSGAPSDSQFQSTLARLLLGNGEG